MKKNQNINLDAFDLPIKITSSLGAGSPNPTRPGRFSAPKGWEPGVVFGEDGLIPQTITTATVAEAKSEKDWIACVKEMGILLPEGYTVRLLEAKYDPAAWTRSEEGADAITAAIWRYKFAVVPNSGSKMSPSDEILLNAIKKIRASKLPLVQENGKAFVVNYADMQIGKVDDNGGTEETLKRVLDKTYAVVERIKNLRKTGSIINEIVIGFGGDCIEGVTSQGGRLATRQDLFPTEQVRILRRTMATIIKILAPLAAKITVVGIPGNHDEATRQFASVQTDSWDLEALSSVQDTLAENPEAFGHVHFVFPQYDRSTVTINISGTIVGFAHGHKFKGGAEKWWAGQAHGLQPIGEATLLFSGHFHHLRVIQSGRKTWIQCPALDGGSRWFTETSGAESAAGLLTCLVGDGSWDDLKVL